MAVTGPLSNKLEEGRIYMTCASRPQSLSEEGQGRTSGNSLKVDRLAFHTALPPTEELIPQSISTAGAIEDAAGQLAYSQQASLRSPGPPV